ncbi:MAG TPA: hypothetical protein VLI46_00955 [Ramlibacter sp.]|nr:hypothetical protein [Ramlibacter sp.]
MTNIHLRARRRIPGMNNRRLTLAFCLLAMVTAVRAAEPELMAGLSVMGYGYKVKVSVNGADVGIEGGKSESRRLFNKGHEMAAQATPAIRAKNFVLVPGANEVAIEFQKIDPKSADVLELTFQAQGYAQPLLSLVNKAQASGKHVVKVTLAPKPPPDFKTVVIGDAK